MLAATSLVFKSLLTSRGYDGKQKLWFAVYWKGLMILWSFVRSKYLVWLGALFQLTIFPLNATPKDACAPIHCNSPYFSRTTIQKQSCKLIQKHLEATMNVPATWAPKVCAYRDQIHGGRSKQKRLFWSEGFCGNVWYRSLVVVCLGSRLLERFSSVCPAIFFRWGPQVLDLFRRFPWRFRRTYESLSTVACRESLVAQWAWRVQLGQKELQGAIWGCLDYETVVFLKPLGWIFTTGLEFWPIFLSFFQTISTNKQSSSWTPRLTKRTKLRELLAKPVAQLGLPSL